MTREPGGGDKPTSSEGGPLIFVSDASVEAERVTAALRSRGYVVVDVPLGLLVSRVAVQRPALIVCDADASEALETIARLREMAGGRGVDVLFLGIPDRVLDEKADEIARDGSGKFYRPVDLEAVLSRIESLAGAAPLRSEAARSSPTGYRSPVLVASTRKPYRYEGALAHSSRPSPPSSDPNNPPPSSSTPSVPEVSSSRFAPPPSSARGADASRASLSAGSESPRTIPQSELSPELQKLLADAERRLGSAAPSMSMAPPRRLAPEDEVEAVLPAEVLAALDEPLELEDDEEFGSAAGGTRGGPEPERRGSELPSLPSAAPPTAAGERVDSPALPTEPPEVDLASTSPPRRNENAETTSSQRLSSAGDANTSAPAKRSTIPPSFGSDQRSGSAFTAVEAARVTGASQSPPSGPGTETLAGLPTSATSAGIAASIASLTAEASSSSESVDQISTAPPRAGVDSALSEGELPAREPDENRAASLPEIPTSLVEGDTVRTLARLIGARYTGALVIEETSGIRRVVFRDGDFVTVASGIEGESLVEFLVQRGDLTVDAAARLGRKLPQFGRHTGAALIAQGHLKQDELWGVLRGHAEWLLGRILDVEKGMASLELTVPERLRAEPAVFGGATGAEVLVEVVRRVVLPDKALARIGGLSARVQPGSALHLLGECALSDADSDLVRRVQDAAVEELLELAQGNDFAPTLYVLSELGVVQTTASDRSPRSQASRDNAAAIDDDAVRARILARKSLVDEADYFALLGVTRGATGYDVRRAYLGLRKEFEPARILSAATVDLADDVRLIVDVLDEAYEILRDDARRERYRRALEATPRTA